MRKLILPVFTFISLFCLSAADAYARSAEEVKQLTISALQNVTNKAALQGLTIQQTGNVVVEQGEGFYGITLPHIKLVMPDQSIVDLGITSINASETGKDSLWELRMAVATPIRIKDGQSNSSFELHLPTQNIDVLWHEKASVFTSFFGKFTNAVAKDYVRGTEMSFGSFLIESAIDTPNVDYHIQQKELLTNWNQKKNASDFTITPEDFALVDGLFNNYIGPFGNGRTVKFTADNIVLSEANQPQLRIGKIAFDQGLSINAATNNGSFIGNINVTDIASLNNQPAPDFVKVSFLLNNFPYKEATDLLRTTFKEAFYRQLFAERPSSISETEKALTFSRLKQQEKQYAELLKSAASAKKTHLVAEIDADQGKELGVKLRLDMKGAQTLMGGVGHLELNFSNFNRLKEILFEQAKSTDNVNAEQTLQIALGLVENLGVKSTDANGTPKMQFKFVLGEDGQVTMNNMNIQMLMAMAMPVIATIQSLNTPSPSTAPDLTQPNK